MTRYRDKQWNSLVTVLHWTQTGVTLQYLDTQATLMLTAKAFGEQFEAVT